MKELSPQEAVAELRGDVKYSKHQIGLFAGLGLYGPAAIGMAIGILENTRTTTLGKAALLLIAGGGAGIIRETYEETKEVFRSYREAKNKLEAVVFDSSKAGSE